MPLKHHHHSFTSTQLAGYKAKCQCTTLTTVQLLQNQSNNNREQHFLQPSPNSLIRFATSVIWRHIVEMGPSDFNRLSPSRFFSPAAGSTAHCTQSWPTYHYPNLFFLCAFFKNPTGCIWLKSCSVQQKIHVVPKYHLDPFGSEALLYNVKNIVLLICVHLCVHVYLCVQTMSNQTSS